MRTIYTNGAVYTGELPLCQSFVQEDGRFLYAGGTEEAMTYRTAETRVVDLDKRFVCPGFNDSHMHLVNFGYSLQAADLGRHTSSLAEVQEELRRFHRANPDLAGGWLRGRGWNQDYFTDVKRFPNRYDLDQVSRDVPICIARACGHACVVNSRALEITGVTGSTPQPEGGRFEVDENGQPLGIFRENAMDLVYNFIPAPDRGGIKEMILAACATLNRYGVTSSQSDDFLAFPNVPWEETLEAYRELEQEGKLTVRVNEQSQFPSLKELKRFIGAGYNTGWGDSWFRIGPLKMLGDGSLGSRTAYLSRPYADDPGTRGIPIYTRDQFREMIGYAHEHNMQAAIHAIGDGILDDVLAVYREVLERCPRGDHRHGVVHCQITRPDQLEAFRELGLHAYVQSIFLDYDIHIVRQRVGEELAKSSYNFKTLMDYGVRVSNGSDCPVEQPDVMAGIQCAVTRKTLRDHLGPYLPDQAMTVQEALDSFTGAGAYASFEEEHKGRICPGMLADFVVLEKNPFETPVEEIAGIAVLAAFVDGKCVYRRENRENRS